MLTTNRKDLLKRLKMAQVGVSDRGILEQSECFVFTDGRIIAFNDEVLVNTKGLKGIEGAVRANELILFLERYPDKEVTVEIDQSKLKVKGKRRQANLTLERKIRLPFITVPKPETWHTLEASVPLSLQYASEVCGQDETQWMSTCVHVTPRIIEACDNYRAIRIAEKTGFPQEVCLPAASIERLLQVGELSAVSISGGWCHFKTKSDAVVSLRTLAGSYRDDIKNVGLFDAEEVKLPARLKEIVSRATVLISPGYAALVKVELKNNRLVVESHGEAGWYAEEKKVPYKGSHLAFEVNPKLLQDLLGLSHTVEIGKGKMRIKSSNMVFTIVLQAV